MSKRYIVENEVKVADEALTKANRLLGVGVNDVQGIDHIIGVDKILTVNIINAKYPAVKFKMVKSTSIELSKSSLKRMRYRGSWWCKLYDGQEPSLAYCTGFYYHVLRQKSKEVFDIRDLARDKALIAEVSDAAFLHGERFDKFWRYYCHLKRLQDFRQRVDPVDFMNEVDYWLTPKLHRWFGDEELFYKIFEDNTYAHYQGLVFKKPELFGVSLRDWIDNRTNWANSGSGFVKMDRFELKDVKRTKWADAWFYSTDEILAAVTTQEHAYNKVLQKPEVGKVRGVIGSDLVTYLRMKFCWDTCLSGFYSEWDKCPVFMSPTQRIGMWRNISLCDAWNMPLDQSEFDQMQTARQVMIVLKAAGVIMGSVGFASLWVWDLLIKSISTGVVLLSLVNVTNENVHTYEGQLSNKDFLHLLKSVKSGVVEWPWLNGIMSGWFLTAYLDTVVNVVTFNMALLWSEKVGWNVRVKLFYAQGDDDAISVETYRCANMLMLAYISMGFKVNRAKFYISQTRHEFLRRTISKGRVDGYPARTVANILFMSPERTITDNNDVLSSRLSLWQKFANRLNIDIKRLPFVRDLCGASRWLRKDVMSWLSTPTSFGGGGLFEPELESYGMFRHVKCDIEIEPYKVVNPPKGWLAQVVDYSIVDNTLLNSTLVPTIPLRKNATPKVTTDIKRSQWVEAVPNPKVVIGVKPTRVPSFKYAPQIGRLGKYTSHDPLNKEEIDDLITGFTNRLRNKFTESGISVTAPRVAGYSEEMCSYVSSFYDSDLFLSLVYKHRATVRDLEKLSDRYAQSIVVTLRGLDFVMAE